MSEKQQVIDQMLAMQQKFINKEQKTGVDMQEYFTPKPGSELDGYRQEYNDLAIKLVDIAHTEKGSHR
ncbi:MAG: hypothetical protein DRQ51_08920 [Gammaproteobacteria bacterium]|nr:MAG: hypothetical protein DRQ51_08920 [Gammaproteobacteria bacterium]